VLFRSKEDQNCSGQGGDGCNSSPLWTEEKRATFNGPIWSVLGTWASTLSGTTFNEMRAYYGVNKIRITSNLAGTSGIDLLEQNAGTGQFTERSYPGAAFGSSTTGGLEGETSFYLNNSLTRVMGKHQLKVGGQAARVTFLMDIDASQKGRWGFPVDLAYNIADPNSHPDTFNAAIGTATHEESKWNYALYLQDTWQVTDKFTLNLGLRYDYFGPQSKSDPKYDSNFYWADEDFDLSGATPRDTVVLLVRGGTGLETDPGDFGAIPVTVD